MSDTPRAAGRPRARHAIGQVALGTVAETEDGDCFLSMPACTKTASDVSVNLSATCPALVTALKLLRPVTQLAISVGRQVELLRGPEARHGLLVERPCLLVTHGQQEEAVWCLGQDVGHVRLSSRAETLWWAGARPGTEGQLRGGQSAVTRTGRPRGECHG